MCAENAFAALLSRLYLWVWAIPALRCGVGRVVVVGRISPNPGWVNGFVVDDPQATSHPNISSKQIK
jgi:hypothetical protein